MGVPKFFRWISERYPGISQLIAENRIPEFDCLYLDMNGIIHNCTHKDAGEDVAFRLSEEEMFIRIFNYIEHLFGKIKPKKLFYMAIDGVAPRAKMNQQRARRFRTALDAEKAREKAVREGVELPKEPPFDSNCITPGTEFMAKLSHQLRYFINKKVSEDSDWQGCEVVLSGHEVPGEGEHKIMEYIRNAKAQPEYSPDIRHCLYGLDADLIMLGLLSHDPHFCLLREEVTFGRASKSKSKELEHQNFYLLHLCIVREYLELEFQELKDPETLGFPFDLERIIDDFILMAFFVGNDFLPNLPWLHINEGALAYMFRVYKRILPKCEGYINELGVINLKRLELLLTEISQVEFDHFENDVANEKWFQSKQMEESLPNTKKKTPKGQLIITSAQRDLWKKKIKPFVTNRSSKPLNLGSGLKAEDREFVKTLADTLRLEWTTQEDESGNRSLVVSFPPKPAGFEDEDDDDDDDDEEANMAVFRVVKQYDRAMVVDVTSEQAQANYDKVYQEKYQGWKSKYYLQKFEWPLESYDAELVKLCENYVQGLQWVLYYYYRGIVSWPWFYRYHYSPLMSDVVKGLGADLNFKKGEPFKPYEQLMGVLPDRSKSIVPKVYWELMTDPNSPIYDFYPREFELDMNGKKMDWEAVVKIPFIDEERLLNAMAPKNKLLTSDEDARNQFGVALKFTYSPDVDYVYPSSLVGVFPDLPNCHCVENIFELPDTEGLEYRVGLVDGAKLNIEALAGFPTLHTLPYEGLLVEGYGINVFQSESRNPSMIITLTDSDARSKPEYAIQKLGKRCFVGYPFLQEAKVIKVSDSHFNYQLDANGHVSQTPQSGKELNEFPKEANYIENWHARRLGITIGTVETLVHVHMLKGLVKTEEGALIKEYGENPSLRSTYASQTIVDEVVNEDERFIEKAAVPIEEEFPVNTQAFFLGDFNYGRPLIVSGHSNNKAEIRLSVLKQKEPEFAKAIIHEAFRSNRYVPSYAVAKQLGIDALVLSKITSSYRVNTGAGLKVNLGLNLKFAAKGQKVLGYSQKSGTGWEFSNTAIQLIASFMVTFPDFFAAMHRVAVKSDVADTDLWPDPTTAGTRIKEIGAWLKQQGISKLERVPLEAEQLDSNVVMKLAEVGEEVSQLNKEPAMRSMKGVPRSAILKPADTELLLGNQKFALGDRVTYVSAAGKVPLSVRGTVVGISRTATALLLDVVWDQAFMSGNTLGDRTPPFRGQTVPASSVLNTTNKQVVTGSKAALGRNPVRAVPALTTSSYDTTGMPQYRDATPPPPLRGGWSGAVNGGRGRGRGGRGGQPGAVVNLAHRPHPNASGTNSPRGGGSAHPGVNGRGRGRGGPRGYSASPHTPGSGTESPGLPGKTQYNMVPPPSNLDTPPSGERGGRGRGRGRGGHRGRGGGFNRGRGGASSGAGTPSS